MLHIILFILKILGYMLLAVLGLLLLVLLITLFVPIKYQLFGSYMDKPDLSAKITWLFGIIKAQAEFHEKHFRLHVKIAWKTLFDTDNQEKDEALSEDNITVNASGEKSEAETLTSEASSLDQQVSDKRMDNSASDKAEVMQLETAESDDKQKLSKRSKKDDPNKVDRKKNKKSLFRKKSQNKKKSAETKEKRSVIELLAYKIEALLDRLDLVSENIEEKMESLSCKWHKIEKFLTAECTQNSIALLLKMLKSILKHVAPKDVEGRVHFGMDKPSTTGKILGYASAFYPLYANKVQLEPDFEKAVIEGHLNVRGGIRLYIFVFWALRMILCKDIRKLIKYIKHLKK